MWTNRQTDRHTEPGILNPFPNTCISNWTTVITIKNEIYNLLVDVYLFKVVLNLANQVDCKSDQKVTSSFKRVKNNQCRKDTWSLLMPRYCWRLYFIFDKIRWNSNTEKSIVQFLTRIRILHLNWDCFDKMTILKFSCRYFQFQGT